MDEREEPKIVECDDCGNEIPEENAYLINRNYYCGDCISTCEICDEMVPRGELRLMYRTRGRRTIEIEVCEDCYNDYALSCDACGDAWHSDDLYICECGNERLCESCHDRDGFQCSCMNQEDEEDENIMCYSYKPNPIFHPPVKSKTTKENLYLGVELEVDRIRDRKELAGQLHEISDCGDLFYMKLDGSLSNDGGLEIVTHPMTVNYHRNDFDWKQVLDLCRNYEGKSHNAGNCGLHIHFNKNYLTNPKLDCYKLMILMHRFKNQMVKFSRRTTFSYCQDIELDSIKASIEREAVSTCDEMLINENENWMLNSLDPGRMRHILESYYPEIRELPTPLCSTYENIAPAININKWRMKSVDKHRQNGKYYAINISNSSTVEIRLWRGTLKYETLIATIEFTNALVKFCKYNSVAQVERITWNDFIKKLLDIDKPKYMKEYLKREKLLDITETNDADNQG